MIPKIIVCRTSQVEEFITENTKAVISIIDPGEELPKALQNKPEMPQVTLEFGDTDPYGATEEYPCASVDDIHKIIYAGRKFLADYKKAPEAELLIHCRMGSSRSTAAAVAIWGLWLPTTGLAMEQLVLHYPSALPNRWMIAVADRLLQYGDRLYVAVDEYYATGMVVTAEARVIRGTNASLAF